MTDTNKLADDVRAVLKAADDIELSDITSMRCIRGLLAVIEQQREALGRDRARVDVLANGQHTGIIEGFDKWLLQIDAALALTEPLAKLRGSDA